MLTKQLKDPYNKNFKSLNKEIEEDIRNRKDLPCSCIGRINIIKIAILSKAIYRFNAVPSKSQHNSLQTTEKAILNFMEKHKSQDSQNNPVK